IPLPSPDGASTNSEAPDSVGRVRSCPDRMPPSPRPRAGGPVPVQLAAPDTPTSTDRSHMQPTTSPAPPGPTAPAPLDLSRLAQDLQIRKVQVEAAVQLLDEGNTVPFITRYRKERTGGLAEEVLRRIQARVAQMRQLADRKQTILKSLEVQGKLTDELRHAVLAAETPKRLEDLYLPFKPKKKSLAGDARERGLGPLAEAIWNRAPEAGNLAELMPTLINPDKQLNTPED